MIACAYYFTRCPARAAFIGGSAQGITRAVSAGSRNTSTPFLNRDPEARSTGLGQRDGKVMMTYSLPATSVDLQHGPFLACIYS